MAQRTKKKEPAPIESAPPAATAAPRRTAMGIVDLVLGALLVVGVWALLPVRWWPVDAGATVLGAGFVVSGALLLRAHPLAERIATIVAGTTLAIGVVVIAVLAYTIGSLYGLYGPVGQGGAALLLVALVLLVPYLVVFPAAQVYFLLPRAR